jgi:hypothetical protein
MTTLYEITDDILALHALLDEAAGEITPEVEAWMAEYGTALGQKADRIAGLLRQKEAEAKVYKGEEEFFALKRRAAENTAKALKALTQQAMETLGEVEFRGEKFRLCLTPNGGKAPVQLTVTDPAALPTAYQRVSVAPDTDALRAALEQGVAGVEAYATLGARGYHVRVR